MSSIRDLYQHLRLALGGSYGLIILFMFLPFMVISCGSGESRQVLASQDGKDFLMFKLPDAGNSGEVNRNKDGIYVMGAVAWLILLTAIVGIALVVKNANLKTVGIVIGSVGAVMSLVFMGFVWAGDAKMKKDMASASEIGGSFAINIEVGTGLTLIFLFYLASGVFAMLQNKPAASVRTGDNLPLEVGEPDASKQE